MKAKKLISILNNFEEDKKVIVTDSLGVIEGEVVNVSENQDGEAVIKV